MRGALNACWSAFVYNILLLCAYVQSKADQSSNDPYSFHQPLFIFMASTLVSSLMLLASFRMSNSVGRGSLRDRLYEIEFFFGNMMVRDRQDLGQLNKGQPAKMAQPSCLECHVLARPISHIVESLSVSSEQ
jgi:hypothetical protein